MTDAEKIAELQEAVSRLEAIVGVKYASVAPQPSDIGPHNELPSGRYPLMLSDYQLRLQGIVPITDGMDDLRNRVSAVEARPQPAPEVSEPPADIRSQLEPLGFLFASDGTLEGLKMVSLGAPEGPFYAYVGANDLGLRAFSGVREKIGGTWPEVDRNPNVPIIMGPVVERDGAVSWDFEPPMLASEPNPRPNKTFLMYFAGFRRGVGPRGKDDVGPYMDFGTFEADRGIRWFIRRPGSSGPDTETILQMDAGGLAFRVGGGLRRIHMEADGTLRAGEAIIEDQ